VNSEDITRKDVTANDPKPAVDAHVTEIDSESLLKGGREVLIRHQGQVYRLRLTRNGKLILNK
jgi:hemin uptake protein HemP